MSRRTPVKKHASPKRLRLGDLVRVSAFGIKSSKRLKDREGHLGRIAVVETAAANTAPSNDDNANNQNEEEEQFSYTVEWVLGGRKLTGVRREELSYTTAEREGMLTDDGDGGARRTNRRKRERPTDFMEEVAQKDAAKRKRKQESSLPSSNKAAATTNATTKKPKTAPKPAPEPKKAKSAPKAKAKAVAATKKSTKKATKEAPSKKPKVVKKKKITKKPPPTKKKTAAAEASNEKVAPTKKSAKQEEADAAKEAAAAAALALYEKHRREFERILTRLEKVDKFGYFWDEAPPEFDETLTQQQTAEQQTNAVNDECDAKLPAVAESSETTAARMDPTPPPVEANNKDDGGGEISSTNDVDAGAVDVTSSASGQPKQDKPTEAASSELDEMATDPQDQPSVAVASSSPTAGAASTTEKEDDGVPPPPVFPSHPPFNWKMVRRRMELGRYVQDRQAHEEEQRYVKLDLYYRSLGKHRPRRKFTGYALNKKKKKKTAAPTDNPRILHLTGVDWDLFRDDVVGMCDAAIARDEHTEEGNSPSRDSLTFAANKVKEAVLQVHEKTGCRHMKEMSVADDRHKFWNAIEKNSNKEPAMQSWRQSPFPERLYERLSEDKVCDGLSQVDERIATYERKTSLPDSFVGISYRYDDTGQSEAWMKSVVDETGDNSQDKDEERKAALALAADDGVTRAQVVATMQTLLIGVQDRVMTDGDVLHQPELRSANWEANEERREMRQEPTPEGQREQAQKSPGPEEAPEIVEQPVWGIDKYTRRNVTVCLRVEFDEQTVVTFIEKWLLPAINACPPDLAQDIANAARLLEGLPFVRSTPAEPQEESMIEDDVVGVDANWSQTRLGKALRRKIDAFAPPFLKAAASELRRARTALGPDFFRVHPKGHGSVMLSPRVKANRLVTFYRGELYPSWRWGEKMDAIDLTQQRKNLKPALPDFYNMALERPQLDPRGYGMLFVDASRKAGHGSSLSHSCDPTCEVRVAAKNGELCLAMTTLRELEMGEELTFDYNAVTESLNEYRSAVCLCGHNKCRGSFLHFATADCYQQVLNRNAPIASRFSNLVKGSMKKVMSEDDERVLRNHGFHTAAFGAISVNRREASMSGRSQSLLDSLDIVPVWLRTYVADALRYIEYERRALPISLICEHLSSVKKKKAEAPAPPVAAKPSKPPGREPSFFYFSRIERDFLRSLLRKEGFPETATGLELKYALLKVGSAYWKSLPAEKKQYWKERADADHEKKRKAWLAEQKGKKKPAAASKGKKDKENVGKTKPEISDVLLSSKISFQDADAEGVAAMEQRIQQLTQTLSRVGRVLDRHRERELESGSASLRKDESTSCRLQALRNLAHSPLCVLEDEKVVGWMWNSHDGIVPTLIRNAQSAPCVRPELLRKLTDTKKKYSLLERFADPTGGPSPDAPAAPNGAEGRRQLNSALLEMRKVILAELKEMAKEVRRFKAQSKVKPDAETQEAGDVDAEENVEADDSEEPQKGSDEPETMGEIVSDSKMETEMPQSSSAAAIIEPRLTTDCLDCRQGDPAEEVEDREAIRGIVNELVDKVVDRLSDEKANPGKLLAENRKAPLSLESDPWLNHYSQRFILQVSADMLLFYAHTNNFFAINPYHVLESTAVDVYARELGNSVPRSIVDDLALPGCLRVSDPSASLVAPSEGQGPGACDSVASDPLGDAASAISAEEKSPETTESVHPTTSNDGIAVEGTDLVAGHSRIPTETVESAAGPGATTLTKGEPGETAKSGDEAEGICEPDDIVASVVVRYQGDYILSQLLQWYNGGIGQKPGLPDLLGCSLLPSMQSCWSSSLLEKHNPKPSRRTVYELKIRRKLIQWLQDPFQRGNPWSDDVRCAFEQPDEDILRLEDSSSRFVAFGTPVIDFLVTGDESSIHRVLDELDADDKVASKKNSDGLLSSLDKGRPAQAVSTWVQCENPDCMKWRKIPWHVDVDLLPEKFYCKDNVWNPGSNSCDAPEDDWDHADSLVDENGKVEGSPIRKKKTGSLSPLDEKNFVTGAKFDVRRTGKDKYVTATVIKVDFSGKVKRIQFRFAKTHAKYDEWIEFGSDRIARLNTKTSLPDKGADPKAAKKSGDKVVGAKGAKKSGDKVAGSKGTKKSGDKEAGPKATKKKKKKREEKAPGSKSTKTKKNGDNLVPSEGAALGPFAQKPAPSKRKKPPKNTDGKQSKTRKVSSKNGASITATGTQKDVQCDTSSSIEVPPRGGPVAANSGHVLGQAVWQGRPDELGRTGLHEVPGISSTQSFQRGAGGFRSPSNEMQSSTRVDFHESLATGGFASTQSPGLQARLYSNGEYSIPSNSQLADDLLAASSNYQLRDNGNGLASARQLLLSGLGVSPSSHFAGNGIGVSPIAASLRNNGAALQGTYDGHLPESGLLTNPFVSSMHSIGVSSNPLVSSMQNSGVSLQDLQLNYGRQFMGNATGMPSPNSFVASVQQNNGVSLRDKYPPQLADNGMGSLATSMQNNGASLRENYDSPLNTTAAHSAAYDLLLLSSVARTNSAPARNFSADPLVSNAMPPTPGASVLSTSPSNGSSRFTSVNYPQTDQQAIFDRRAYNGNPFNRS